MAPLRIVPAPRLAAMYAYDCARCGHPEVRPVFLSDGHAYGSGCAAVMLGRPGSARKVLIEAAAADRLAAAVEEMLAERRERFGRALAAFHADPNAGNPDLDSCRRTYWQSGGAAALGMFPAWLAAVAETGSLDPAPQKTC